MRFGLLGSTGVRLPDGGTAAVGGPRVRALLAMLLLDSGRVVPVERLIDGLYGERPPADAANALQSQVSRLRRALKESGVAPEIVEHTPAGYRIAVAPQDVDVLRVEALARAGDYAGALAEWAGEPLADVLEAPFAAGQRTRLDQLHAEVVEGWARSRLEAGGGREVIATLQKLISAYPLREPPRLLLMQALAADGRQAEALDAFAQARRVLADELGADPSPELAAAHLALLRPAPAALPPRLPAQLTSFVGRADELTRLSKLLGETRLVTLIGPGGTGKTRLALETGLQASSDEVCFVDLSATSSGPDLPQVLLIGLGLRDSGVLAPTSAQQRQDPMERLISALAERRMLLLLDNCEHVIAAAATLAHRLLAACPGLRILATSREPLGITGEVLCPLGQLAVAPEGAGLAEALSSPAVRLFADRAAAVSPGFGVDESTVDDVLHICRSLDGSPLAIELAAARLRTLSPGEIAARLDDRFRLLSRGSRTAAPRHQTLRAVVEWSWELLDERERELARRFTVFVGGATLEAVAQVCQVEEAPDVLAGLVDKCLVELDRGRYRMLDTIRAFCAEQLAEAGEEARFGRSHVDFCLRLAEVADPGLRGPDQLSWLARLNPETGNLHAALRWAVGHDPGRALRLVALLSWYWWLRGLRREGAALSRELLHRLDEPTRAAHPEEFVLCVVNVSVIEPGLEAEVGRAARYMADRAGEPGYPALTVLWALTQGPTEADTRDFERREQFFGADKWSQGLLSLGAGFMRVFTGDPVQAEADFAAGLVLFREAGDRWGMTGALDQLAGLAEWRGDRERFLSLMGEAARLIEELGAVDDMADLLNRRADGLRRFGEHTAARADHERAAEIARRAGLPLPLATAVHGLAELARLDGDAPEALRLNLHILPGIKGGSVPGDILRTRVLVALARLDAPNRRKWMAEAVGSARQSPLITPLATVAECLADLVLQHGDAELAAELLGAGEALRGTRVEIDPDAGRTTAAATSTLGATRFAEARARGSALSRAQATDLLTAGLSALGA